MTRPSENTSDWNFGRPTRLLRRDVPDGAGARRLQRALRDLREAEVRELQLVARKQDEVVGLDVAVNHARSVRVRHRRKRLLDQIRSADSVDSRLRMRPLERALAERHRDHEPSVDERRVANRQDVRMLEPMREPRLALEVHEEVARSSRSRAES